MTNERRETTISDYLQVLRRRRGFILLVVVFCLAAALVASLVQKPSYDATASLSVQDLNQSLTVIGSGFVSNQTPLQLASAHVPQVTRTEVLQRVKKSLRSPLTINQLRSSISVTVDPNSNLVNVDAHNRHANDAAAIANAVVQTDASLTTAEVRRNFRAQAAQLARKVATLAPAKDLATRAIYIDQLSRLQSLSSVATPVQVGQMATVPTTPSSPKPVRNGIAAAIFGLFLGIALAYGREALDHRLKHTADVEEAFDRPVIGHIRSEALGHAGAASNGRGPLADVDQESFQILRQNVKYLAADEGLRSLVVTSAMAQEGKSTVASCLAAASAAAGKQTMLIECDLRRPVLAQRFGLVEQPGLTDYLTGNAEPHEVMQYVAATASGANGADPEDGNAPYERFVCITSGTPAPRPAELLGSARFQGFLAEVTAVYDAVILDSAPLLSVADTLEIIPHVSGVLVCVRLEQTTRDQARAARAALDRLPARPVGVVLTDVRESGEGYYGYYGSPAAASYVT
jgi:capsular exopolysaccharide synthesis family protein